MAGRNRAAAGIFLLTFIIILSVTAAPVFARSSPRVLRCPVVERYAKYVVIKHASPHFRLKLHRDQHSIKVRGVRYKIVKLTNRLAKLRRANPRPKTPPTPTPPVPTPTPPVPTPTPTPSPSATVVPTSSPGLILTASDIALLRQRVAAGEQPYAGAWQFFRDGKVKAAQAATPTVDVGPTNAFSYTLLDTDSRHARDLAVAYAATGSTSYAAEARDFVTAWARANHPASYAFTGDFQGGYHQSYGAFAFAFAYDLTRDAGVYSADDQTTVRAWFRTWATVMKGYQDNYAKDYWFTHTGRHAYDWPGSQLTYDQTDFYTGTDTSASPAAAWLAAAIVSGDAASIATLFDSSYTLNVPDILHASTHPDNDGDGRSAGPVPQVLIKKAGYYDNASRGGCVDYMSYNARLASMLYEMTVNLGRGTSDMRSELRDSWVYLSQFSGPGAVSSPAPNDVVHWNLQLSRIQCAAHLFGEQRFLDDVNGGQFPRVQFYESQFLGPTTLTQP